MNIKNGNGWKHPGKSSHNYGRSIDHDHDKRTYAGIGPRSYHKSDESIKEEVCEILFWNPDVDSTQVEVSVESGVVRLEGFVDSRHAKRTSEAIIEDIFGIVDIQNELIIKKDLDMNSDKIITRGDDGLHSEETIPR